MTAKDDALEKAVKVILILALVAFVAPSLLRRAMAFVAVDLI